MKFQLFQLLFLCNFLAVNAQTTGNISGKVVDSTTKKAFPYANVNIKKETKIITGGITSENGNFTIKEIPFDSYTVEIQFIGYKTYSKKITLNAENKSINLNTISLEEAAAQLDEVQVVSEKSTFEQKIDRKVINVGKDLISAGATAGEIMNNIPSVSVDPQTNAISLRGNENVRVLIDGKPSNIDVAQLLKQIPSSSIKQVELITNPSAKYNPEGMSGIINIILHKNTNTGFNGSFNNGVTFGKTPKANSSLDLNYKVGKVNIYGNYGFNHGYQANHGNINGYKPGDEKIVDMKFRNKNTSHLIKAGIDYYVDDFNTVSFYTNQNRFSASGNSSIYVDNLVKLDDVQNNSNKNKNPSETYNLDYKHKFKKEGENIEFEANFNKNVGNENSIFVTQSPIVLTELNAISNDNMNTKINLDYTNPFKDNSKLELGSETRIENANNNYDLNNTFYSDFEYKRNIHSVYATFGKQWKKWGFQVGTRFENYTADALFHALDSDDENANGNTSEIIAKTFNDKINTLYPSGYVSYKMSDKNSFNFNYSRRVDRPSIGQVNPIREWSTPTVKSVGNPYLKPQFTNSFELNYTRKTKIGSISTVVFYRIINQEITRFVQIDPTNNSRNIMSYANFKDNDSYGAEISGNLDFAKWWSANLGTDIYFRTIRGTVDATFVERKANIFNARINNTFKANKNLRFQLFGMYRGQEQSLQFLRNPMYRMDIGASYNVLKGKGTLSARASDIFDTMRFSFDGDLPYAQDGSFNWESRTLYLGFNYRFGGGKNAALQRKQRDKNETQGGGGMM